MLYVMCNLLCNVSKYVKLWIVVGILFVYGNIGIFVEDDGFGVFESECEWIFDVFVCFDCCIGGYGFGLLIMWQVFYVYNGWIVVVDLVEFGGVWFEISWLVQ